MSVAAADIAALKQEEDRPIQRITAAAIASMMAFFDKYSWEKLPCETELLKLPEVISIVAEHGLPASGLRVKFIRQFKKWHDAKKPGSTTLATSSHVSSSHKDAVMAMVQQCAGNISDIARGSLNEVRKPIVLLMPWAGAYLETVPEDFERCLCHRIEQLLKLIVSYASMRSQTSTMSAALENDINASRIEFINKLQSHAHFSGISRVPTADLGAQSPQLAMRIILDRLDRALTKTVRLRFAPSAREALTIPNAPSDVITNKIFDQTIYYVAGWLLSCVFDMIEKDCALESMLTTFVSKNSLTCQEAKDLKLPCELVDSRNRGKLLYPSYAMYALVVQIEFAFSSLLTMPNLIAYGGKLISATLDAIMNSDAISLALHECMRPVYDAALEALEQTACNVQGLEARCVLDCILQKYIRMRGKDMVKSILSVFTLSKSAKTALSHRGALAAASKAAPKKHKADCSAASSSIMIDELTEDREMHGGGVYDIVDCDEFDAMDEDLHDARIENDDADMDIPVLDEI